MHVPMHVPVCYRYVCMYTQHVCAVRALELKADLVFGVFVGSLCCDCFFGLS